MICIFSRLFSLCYRQALNLDSMCLLGLCSQVEFLVINKNAPSCSFKTTFLTEILYVLMDTLIVSFQACF